MAQKRMFDKGLLETDDFMDMPMSTKALYFLLGMEADDEGFVSPKRVMRLYGGTDDDIRVLISKKFIIKFESGVIVITNWNENNYLDKNRIKETKYQAERHLLALSNNKYVMLNECLTDVQPEEYRGEENSTEENSNCEETSRNKEIAEIIDLFKKTLAPSLSFGNKTQRKAVEEMLKKWKFEKVKDMAERVISVQGKPYAPRASTPHAMWTKIGDFASYFQSENIGAKSNNVATV